MSQEEKLGGLLREVARLYVQIQREDLACCNGTTVTQCLILTEIARSGGISLADLSRKVGLDKSWTSRAVEALANDGLLAKATGAEDRRTILITLTTAGEKRWAEINGLINRQASNITDFIPANDQPGVQKALELLQVALKKYADQIAAQPTNVCS
jgi:DNA-binding MarR family transcriptional regulator